MVQQQQQARRLPCSQLEEHSPPEGTSAQIEAGLQSSCCSFQGGCLPPPLNGSQIHLQEWRRFLISRLPELAAPFRLPSSQPQDIMLPRKRLQGVLKHRGD